MGLEPALVEANVMSALVTIGLLRSHEPVTQMRCIDALHNVLANSVCRQQVLDSGVIWALQKLVRGVCCLLCCAAGESVRHAFTDSLIVSMLCRRCRQNVPPSEHVP